MCLRCTDTEEAKLSSVYGTHHFLAKPQYRDLLSTLLYLATFYSTQHEYEVGC
jgi:hypothetical protein